MQALERQAKGSVERSGHNPNVSQKKMQTNKKGLKTYYLSAHSFLDPSQKVKMSYTFNYTSSIFDIKWSIILHTFREVKNNTLFPIPSWLSFFFFINFYFVLG